MGKAWKEHEQRIARQIDGVRSGATGRATIDVSNDWLAVECKSWKGSVKRVEGALEQAERASTAEQLPVAIIHTLGRHSKNDLVILRWGDFCEWFGEHNTGFVTVETVE